MWVCVEHAAAMDAGEPYHSEDADGVIYLGADIPEEKP